MITPKKTRMHVYHVVPVVIKLKIIISLRDLLRVSGKLAQRLCDSPLKGHNENDKSDQEKGKSYYNFPASVLPVCIYFIYRDSDIQAHSVV